MPPPREPIIRKRKKPKRKYILPTSGAPRGDAGHDPKPRSRPRTRPAPVTQPGPYREAERQEVEQHKRTPSYRNAIKRSYKEQPVAARQQRIAAAEAKPPSERTREDRAVLDTHRKRAKRDRKLIASQVFTDRQREIVEAFKRSESFAEAIREAASNRKRETSAGFEVDADLFETDAEKLREAGFKPPGTLETLIELPIKVPVAAATGAAATAVAAYHDPVGVPKKTAKQLGQAAFAAPVAAYDFARDPIGTAEEAVDAFEERGNQSFDEKVKTIREHGGLDYIADAAVVTGGASAATRLLRPSVPARPGKRTSGGAVRPQRAASGIVLRGFQNKVDAARARKLERELQEAEAGGKAMPAERHAAAMANRRAGRVVEVAASGRVARRSQRRSVATARSRGILELNSANARRQSAARKAINRLSKKEKRALFYAATYGLRTAEQAREILPGLAASIAAYRKAEGIQVKGSLKRSDMLTDIRELLADPDAAFTGRLGEVVEALRPDSYRAGREDPSLTARTTLLRRRDPQAQLLGIVREAGESDGAFISRVIEAATEHDLASPLYWRSERVVNEGGGFADFALGAQAMRRDKRYEGRNVAAGLTDTRPEQYLQGLARNTKRAKNWEMVVKVVEDNALRELSGLRGAPLKQLRQRAVELGIALDTLSFVNVPALTRTAQRNSDAAHQRFENPEDADAAVVQKALAGARLDGEDYVSDQLDNTSGWAAVPREVVQELERQVVPSGKAGRSWDIAKGKASRAMLYSGNLGWLSASALSNAGMAVVASGGRALNPANWVGAAKLWRELSDADKDRVGAVLGLDVGTADGRQVKMGAAANGALVNAYRTWKAAPFWHTGIGPKGRGPSISDLNPLEAMARADKGSASAFRLVAGYSLVKRDTVRRMGEDMGRLDDMQNRIVSILERPPAEQMRLLLRDRTLLEDYAVTLSDFMGDWTSLTAFERKRLGRIVMFYPFVRFATKLLFWTLPARHPIMTAVLAELSALSVEEYREIFGSDSLPWNVGKLYFRRGEEYAEIDLRKANPVLSGVLDLLNTSSSNPAAAVGIAPPWVGWAYNQLAKENYYTGKDLRVGGKAAPYGGPELDEKTRLRVFLNDALSIVYPYRQVVEQTQSGSQGDDSLAFSPRPITFKGRTDAAMAMKRASKAAEEFERNHGNLLNDLMPLLPRASDDREQAKRSKRIARLEAKPAGRSKPRYFGASE